MVLLRAVNAKYIAGANWGDKQKHCCQHILPILLGKRGLVINTYQIATLGQIGLYLPRKECNRVRVSAS
jgi:hypothetical protein